MRTSHLSRFLASIVPACAVLVLAIARAPAADDSLWPQWRGPNRDGLVAGKSWPASLDEAHLQLLWEQESGPGYSGPIVAADRVFVAETRDKKEEVARALDRQTGQEIWQAGWPGAMSVPFMAKRNGNWIRSTPTYDGQSLFVAGMRDVLVCLDAQSGQERWRVDFMEQLKSPLPAFGFVCSPLVTDQHVYVQAGAGFCKLDKATGALEWRILEDVGGMFGSAFSSPVMTTLAGRSQLIVQTRQKLTGVDPESGDVLWTQTVPATLGMNILTPVQLGDTLFTSAYGAGSFLYRVQPGGDTFSVETVWRKPIQGYMTTPVVIDGHAYFHLRNKRFTCIELATGEQKWSSPTYGAYWSLVAQDHHILALDQRGELLLIRATPDKYDLLASRKLCDDETWGHLAVADDQIFVRRLGGIRAYRWQ